ncbi:MAG: DUF1016 domain-containing protein [Brooklawnia sp.]|nr:DUF1016 domain-containing protein [Brooklawnia sp.]
MDLLFFNWDQSRFVAIELKIGQFAPEHIGQLGFYVSWVDGNLRVPERHAPTIGILLCAGRNDNVVRYSLAGTNQPLAVADYTYDTLPQAARDNTRLLQLQPVVGGQRPARRTEGPVCCITAGHGPVLMA